MGSSNGPAQFGPTEPGFLFCREALPATAPGIPEFQPVVRLLIIDDDPALRDLLARRCRRLAPDTRVTMASNGKQALALVESVQPHLVISDIRMPVLDGLHLAHELRQRFPYLPVILMSSQIPQDVADHLDHSGVRAVISKSDLRLTVPECIASLLNAVPADI
ncbi:response regulator [bacterium]|nr:response regulator [bacterium]